MVTIFYALLHELGLNYANTPKAILPFHQYPDGTRTALEEHVHEAILTAQKTSAPIRIHLTVSGSFEAQVKKHVEEIRQKVASRRVGLELTVSVQQTRTDTIALDSQDHLFRNKHGQLLFRPGGHGALLENLNDYQGDIVCISNIDNVVPDYLKESLIQWRMALAGYMIGIQT